MQNWLLIIGSAQKRFCVEEMNEAKTWKTAANTTGQLKNVEKCFCLVFSSVLYSSAVVVA
jgi:hypothetical protein